MSGYVTDTHALLWHLYGNSKLSPAAKSIFDRADAGDDLHRWMALSRKLCST